MTFPQMSPAHQNPVSPFRQGVNDKVGMDHSRAHGSYNTGIGWILDSCNTGKIRAGIRAPVTAECQNHRFKLIVHLLPPHRIFVGGKMVASADLSHADASDRWKEFRLSFTAGPEQENAPVRVEFQVKQAELDDVSIKKQPISL